MGEKPFQEVNGEKSFRNTQKLSRKQYQRSTKRHRLTYSNTEPNIKRARMVFPDFGYGPDFDQPEDKEELQKKCEEFSLKLQRDKIMQETIGQSQNDKWHEMRRMCLTASNFGVVCKRKDTTPCCNLVRQLLYRPPIMTATMEYGRRNEYMAIK
ncbi:hypothetical protein PR048_018002 [Dryococelus australis]|uniref:Uncharacterized protein n=1 Tax=Dryococelus australis TaxID=614101 RepID=A0ABQ9HB35_9NEOP|nr:hypothetical protein PR048_018002 [Dryococelus australis]